MLRPSLKGLVALCFLFATPNISLAQQTDIRDDFAVSRVALIDLNFVLRNASATVKVRELLDEKKAEFSSEFQVKEAELLERERELNLRRSLLSEADFNVEVQAFQMMWLPFKEKFNLNETLWIKLFKMHRITCATLRLKSSHK